MEENTDNNKILDLNHEQEVLEFKYNFVTTPWDDRTRKSKFWIVVLLVSIFVTTMALVLNNFYMHYKNFTSIKSYKNSDRSCFRLRIDELPYVARLQSAKTYELLCLGAVVSPTSVLANGICIKFGPLRMFIGSTSEPRCRKGFSVDVSESIRHPAVASLKIVLLSSYDNIEKCAVPVNIGGELDFESSVDVIGRPCPRGRTLSKQRVAVADKKFQLNSSGTLKISVNYTIIGKDIGRCPVQAGDLMLQDGRLYGLALRQHRQYAFFAQLNVIKRELKEIDSGIIIEEGNTNRDTTFNILH